MRRSIDKNNTELQQIISDLDLNSQIGEMARALYRKGMASHSDELRDAKKVLFYAQAEVERLEKLEKPVIQELYSGGWTPEAIAGAAFKQPYHNIVLHGHELYSEEDEKRMDVVGSNGNDGSHYWQINRGVRPTLPSGTRIMVEYRNGRHDTDEVHEYDWSLEANDYDIIRWRLA